MLAIVSNVATAENLVCHLQMTDDNKDIKIYTASVVENKIDDIDPIVQKYANLSIQEDDVRALVSYYFTTKPVISILLLEYRVEGDKFSVLEKASAESSSDNVSVKLVSEYKKLKLDCLIKQ